MAETASTWMQVVFGALGLSVAIVGAVIAYFAWVQPHSPGDDGSPPGSTTATVGATTTSGATTSPTPAGKRLAALSSLSAVTGGGNLRPDGTGLSMACASGQTVDRQRSVEYDLLGNYAALGAGLTVSKARDGDTPLQVVVFADDRTVGTYTVTKGGATRRLEVPLTGVSRLRIELTCQFPDGEVRFGDPLLTHA